MGRDELGHFISIPVTGAVTTQKILKTESKYAGGPIFVPVEEEDPELSPRKSRVKLTQYSISGMAGSARLAHWPSASCKVHGRLLGRSTGAPRTHRQAVCGFWAQGVSRLLPDSDPSYWNQETISNIREELEVRVALISLLESKAPGFGNIPIYGFGWITLFPEIGPLGVNYTDLKGDWSHLM